MSNQPSKADIEEQLLLYGECYINGKTGAIIPVPDMIIVKEPTVDKPYGANLTERLAQHVSRGMPAPGNNGKPKLSRAERRGSKTRPQHPPDKYTAGNRMPKGG